MEVDLKCEVERYKQNESLNKREMLSFNEKLSSQNLGILTSLAISRMENERIRTSSNNK